MAEDATLTAEQLRRATVNIIGLAASSHARFGIAVSGGPDSMALLLLAAAAFPGRVAAATVDHGLRPESADEATMVAHHCAALGVPHHILRPAAPITGSLQAAARATRYQLLEQWRVDQSINWLMTAHHADDQLETLILRLNRASGVGGLAGIRRQQGRVLRPLLAFRHGQLVALVADAGISAVDDPSNRDDRFDRIRLRRQLVGQAMLDVRAAAASASHLGDADAALDWAASALANDHLTVDATGVVLRAAAVPAELRRRLMVLALRQLEPQRADPRGGALDRAIALLMAGRSAMLGDVKISPVDLDRWQFAVMPPRRSRQ